MTNFNLTQSEADALLHMEKHATDSRQWSFPTQGTKVEIPLASADKREQFFLDIGRGYIDLKRVTFQNRARQIIILARLDLSGPPHRNPDDSEVPPPHLHLYREGFGDKWACAVPDASFRDLSDQWVSLQDFMAFCRVGKKPLIKQVMF